MAEKFTDWFPGTAKPIRVGLYQRMCDIGDIAYSHWNGMYWGFMMYSKESAYRLRDQRSSSQEAPWRGLVEKPRGS